MRLEYISASEYIKEGYNEDAISTFDCGASSFNTFLKDRMQLWETNLSGVTYFLIDKDENCIVAARAMANGNNKNQL